MNSKMGSGPGEIIAVRHVSGESNGSSNHKEKSELGQLFLLASFWKACFQEVFGFNIKPSGYRKGMCVQSIVINFQGEDLCRLTETEDVKKNTNQWFLKLW